MRYWLIIDLAKFFPFLDFWKKNIPLNFLKKKKFYFFFLNFFFNLFSAQQFFLINRFSKKKKKINTHVLHHNQLRTTNVYQYWRQPRHPNSPFPNEPVLALESNFWCWRWILWLFWRRNRCRWRQPWRRRWLVVAVAENVN